MKVLAPLRGVTVRCFREVFAGALAEAGFAEAITPFVTAVPGFDPLRDRELAGCTNGGEAMRVTPQFIGKDPSALQVCLERVRSAGFKTADLNCGCPFPMVRNKGRGSGILRTPDVLRRMLDVGCAVMGDGNFSVKTRLGVDSPDELARLMPVFNGYPLRFLAVHARTARQMYGGECDIAALETVERLSRAPVVRNGDLPLEADGMIGRAFVRSLGERDDICGLLEAYIDASAGELHGERPVLGRIKELLSYWRDSPRWRRRWHLAKTAATLSEIRHCICGGRMV